MQLYRLWVFLTFLGLILTFLGLYRVVLRFISNLFTIPFLTYSAARFIPNLPIFHIPTPDKTAVDLPTANTSRCAASVRGGFRRTDP